MRRRRDDGPRHSRPRDQGFSLLEILVAFVVLALVLGGVLRVFSGGLSSLDLHAGYVRAAKLAEAQLVGVGPLEPPVAGDAEGEWEGFRWHTRITPTLLGMEELPVAGDLFEVDVAVTWMQGGRDRHLTLSSLRFVPEDNQRTSRR